MKRILIHFVSIDIFSITHSSDEFDSDKDISEDYLYDEQEISVNGSEVETSDAVDISDSNSDDDEEIERELKKIKDTVALGKVIIDKINNRKEMKRELEKQQELKKGYEDLVYKVVGCNVYSEEFNIVTDVVIKFNNNSCFCKKLCNIRCSSRKNRIECTSTTCHAKKCTNRAITKCQTALTSIEHTDEKGYGLFAKQKILANTYICEYVGEVITPREKNIRYRNYGNNELEFLMELVTEKNRVVGYIDSKYVGNCARMINHSCNPNAVYVNWVAECLPRVAIYSQKDIEEGQEICCSYGIKSEDGRPCRCLEINCQGKLPF